MLRKGRDTPLYTFKKGSLPMWSFPNELEIDDGARELKDGNSLSLQHPTFSCGFT
jgi:hypothetical protein